MWKFKKAIISAYIVSMIILIYTLLIKKTLEGKQEIYIHLLNNAFFMLLMSTILFYLIYQSYNGELMAHRFYRIRGYIVFEIVSMIKIGIIFWMIIVLNQMIIFCAFDSLFDVTTFLYRYFILFWVFILFGMITTVGRRKNRMKRMAVGYIGWNVIYIIFCMFPTSMMSQWMPFHALISFQTYAVIRLIVLSVVVCVYVMQKNGRMMIE